ncbi:hypothetical protein ElyMa_001899900 [Elysia marginata]|uniref:Uncharacterized protein n=1 Tax=Elysia marginata TaxID=1093978 RepID=A0AAV4ESQ8_9GAST|nr:hypothetical protein ElyMa_001899900 [Elysia marginata]
MVCNRTRKCRITNSPRNPLSHLASSNNENFFSSVSRMVMEVFLLLMGTGSVIMAYSPSSHAHAHFNSRASSASASSSSSSSSSPSSSSSSSSSSKLMGQRDITFSPGRLNELGSRGQWLLRHIALMTHTCGIRDMASMRRKLLRKSDVTCNDGSYAG